VCDTGIKPKNNEVYMASPKETMLSALKPLPSHSLKKKDADNLLQDAKEDLAMKKIKDVLPAKGKEIEKNLSE
jgi:hypothetical protein